MAIETFIPAPAGWRIRWTDDEPEIDENPKWETQTLIGWNHNGEPLVARTGNEGRLWVPDGTWHVAGPGQLLPGEDDKPVVQVF